jgi:hypothetical protein
MHLYDAIEEYIFDHGKHFDATTGQYDLLMPHELGRPLTHEEMDYNFLYQKQTMNGFRIFGSGTNLRLNDDDKDKVLKFHKIDPSDEDYALYTAAGYVATQYIWIPEILQSPPVVSYISLVASPSVINETNNSTTTFTLQTINAADNTTVDWSIAGGNITANDFTGPLTGTATIVGNQATWTVQASADAVTEGPEVFILTLASVDSAGNDTTTYNGGTALDESVTITDTSLTPAYVSLTSPGTVNEGSSIFFTVNTQNFFQGATVTYELDFLMSTATSADFVGATTGTVSMAANGTGSFSVTTATDLVVDSGETFLVKLVGSDSNGVPTNGISTTATITDIAFPTYTTFTGPSTVQEGNTVTYTLSGTTIPNGATVGYIITGVDVNDISLSSLTGIITMNGGSGTVSFDVLEDYSSEGTETLTITTLGQDSAGNSTGLSMFKNTTITEAASGYTLTGASSITEGTTETYTFTASNVPAGTDFYWELRNSSGAPNVQFAQDLTSARTGTITVQTNGNNVSATFDITAALDMDTEPGENFEVVVYANNTFYDATPPHDNPITNALAQKNVAIIDLAPDYTIVASPSQTEPSTLVAELYTQYVAAGTAYTWEVVPTGANPVEAADFVGGVLPSGSGTIPTYNSANAQSDTFDISVIADNTTEGTEDYKIVVKVATVSVAEKTVNVTDTSQTPAAVVYSMAVSPISIVEDTTAQYMEFTVSTSQADNILPPAGTTVGYTIDGDWSQQDISVIGIGNSSPATLTGGMANPYTGSFELDGNGQGSIRVYGVYDQIVESGGEEVKVTLDAADSAGNATSGANAEGTINDAAAQVWQITGAASQFEGDTFTFEVKTQNVPPENFTWQVSAGSGTPASAADFNPAVFPSGSGTVSANHGTLTTDGTFTIDAAIDALVEYTPEEYVINLYKSNGNLVDTHTVIIVDITQTFDCSNAGMTVDDGLTGQTVTGQLASGTLVGSFNPPTYQSGNQSYSINITAPANDNAGNPYSNAGQNISCSDTANGADITFALSNNGPVNEGQNITWTLTTANVASGTVVPFTLSGTASSPQDYSNNQPFQFTVGQDSNGNAIGANTATYFVTAFADNLTELGAETVIVTLAANDNAGNATGSIASTATINDTSQSPTWDCTDAGLTINNGTTGDPVTGSLSGTGTLVSFSPSTYQSGTTSYTANITVPAANSNNHAYTNAGQNEQCTGNATGNDPIIYGYYFHGGQNNYPANADLTASGSQTYYHDPGTGFTSTTDFDVAMSFVMDNSGTVGNGFGSEYLITAFNIPVGGIPALGNTDVLSFPANPPGEYYYIVLPDGQADLTDNTQDHLFNPNFGANTNAASKKSFTWSADNQLYWVYRLGYDNSGSANTIAFNDSNVA